MNIWKNDGIVKIKKILTSWIKLEEKKINRSIGSLLLILRLFFLGKSLILEERSKESEKILESN